MTALPPDYDTDPGRRRAGDRSWMPAGDTHEPVAARIVAEELTPVLDIGSGEGRLGQLLPADVVWIGIDSSVTQLAETARRPVVRGEADVLPFADGTFAAVAALWMLYHLDDPVTAIDEAARVLRPGGLFVACTSARDSDPELTDGYPATTFDAEEAPDIVASVFGASAVEVERWDGPLNYLPDRDAVVRFCRTHLLPPEAADRVTPPVWLTKRGCLVWARKPG